MRLIKEAFRRLGQVNELFSRVIILGCIIYMAWVVERCMDITRSTGISTTGIIQYSAYFFGGELVMLLAKRVTRDITAARADSGRRQDCE